MRKLRPEGLPLPKVTKKRRIETGLAAEACPLRRADLGGSHLSVPRKPQAGCHCQHLAELLCHSPGWGQGRPPSPPPPAVPDQAQVQNDAARGDFKILNVLAKTRVRGCRPCCSVLILSVNKLPLG